MPQSRDHNRLRNLLRICCHLRRPEHFAADPALVICFRSWLCTGNKCFIHLYDIVILDRGCRFKQLVIAFINVYCFPLRLRPAEQHSIQFITFTESIYIDRFYTAWQHNRGQIITFIKTTDDTEINYEYTADGYLKSVTERGTDKGRDYVNENKKIYVFYCNSYRKLNRECKYERGKGRRQ